MTTYQIGSEDEDGRHMRRSTGWPYSIYVAANEPGNCDRVLAHGIQNLTDAVYLTDLLNRHGLHGDKTLPFTARHEGEAV